MVTRIGICMIELLKLESTTRLSQHVCGCLKMCLLRSLILLDVKLVSNITFTWFTVLHPSTVIIDTILASRAQETPAFATEEMTILNVKSEDCLSPSTRDQELPASQLCAETVELNANECKDTPEGNPLQVRLLHNFKTSPFLVGILSSSFTSGSCNPRRGYTKIGPYRDWLMQVLLERNVSVTPQDFFPIVCAHRFAILRPRADKLMLERNGDVPVNSLQVESIRDRDLNYIVQLEWPEEAKNVPQMNCAGTFVDEQTVLTLAECVIATTPGGIQPIAAIHVTRFRNVSYPIKSIIVHPNYVKSSQKNNIAVVKLQSRQDVVPACIWTYGVLPDSRVDLTGAGLGSLNNYQNFNFDDDRSFNTFVQPAMDYYPWENCTTELAHLTGNRSSEGFSKNEHLCFRSDQWIVPGVCTDVPGAPVLRYINRAGAYFKYVYALTVAGQTCGYGLPTVAVQLAPHVAWLRSVMLDKRSSDGQGTSDSVIVINPDLKRSDECSNGDGSIGICVPYEMCLSTKERLRKGERVTLCTNGTVVCCPWGDIARNSVVNPIRTELDSCEQRYHSIRRQRYAGLSQNESLYTNLPHVAEIGWPQTNGQMSFNCLGYLISASVIVTTARCLETYPHKPTVARIGAMQASDSSNYVIQTIRRLRVHEDYDPQTGVNNIALLILTTPIEINAHHFPGCLYRNDTHLPTRQFVMSQERETTFFEKISPVYQSDCEESLKATLAPGQLCLLKAQPEGVFRVSNRCLRIGDVIVWEHRTEEEDVLDVVYLVGLFSHGECKVENVQIGTRISFYYDWIITNAK
uniref:Peptidase S1 domain-containing protein n=1 Tax=Anopheles christyi TaxID=43041 RepID=A0A182JV90_9DIPT